MLFACSDGAGQFTGSKSDKEAERSEADAERDPNEDDEADVPIIITGAYLTCAETQDAPPREAVFACKLADKKTDKKVPLAQVAYRWRWRAVPPPGTDVKVTVTERGDDSEWHALYRFAGKDDATVKSIARNTEVVLNMDLKKKVPGVNFFSGKLNRLVETSSKNDTWTNPFDFQAPEIDIAAGGEEEKPQTPVCTDADKDCIPDDEDICSHTPQGAPVHKEGEWKGCTEGQYKNTDDVDRDGVPNSLDLCSNTPFGQVVDNVEGSLRRGCSLSEQPDTQL